MLTGAYEHTAAAWWCVVVGYLAVIIKLADGVARVSGAKKTLSLLCWVGEGVLRAVLCWEVETTHAGQN